MNAAAFPQRHPITFTVQVKRDRVNYVIRRLIIFGAALVLAVGAIWAQSPPAGRCEQHLSTEDVRRVTIESSAWNGSRVLRQTLAIRAAKAGFLAKGRPVDGDAIRELSGLLRAAPLPLTLEAVGISWNWLKQNAADRLSTCGKGWLPGNVGDLIASFADESNVLKAVTLYYDESHSIILDDDAKFKLELVQRDGHRIVLHSSQSRAFMIPWTIMTDDRRIETYDTRISLAVLRLLPDGFLNRSRIEGKPHGWDFLCEIGLEASSRP